MVYWKQCLASVLVLGCFWNVSERVNARMCLLEEVTHVSSEYSSQTKPMMVQANRQDMVPEIKQLLHRVTLSLDGVFSEQEIWTAVWSEAGGQDDLVWYKYKGSFGKLQVALETQEDGIYHAHTYSKMGHDMVLMDKQVFQGTLPPQYVLKAYGQGQYQVKLNHLPNHFQTLYLPIWSEKGGQDDLVWYEASLTDDGAYEIVLDIANHGYEVGQYALHLYGQQVDGKLLGLMATEGFTVPSSDVTAMIADDNTYPFGQCTWGVKEQAPWVGQYWGNAQDWGASALAAGYEIGDEARVGAVAVWPNDGVIDGVTYGHVAYVVAVDDERCIRVKEANYAGQWSIQDYRGWFDPWHISSGGQVYYIYPPYLDS